MWEELGISPTSDARAIRRAYAQRLRDAHPDRDPQAFQRLRRAYERALSWAERSSGGSEPSAVLEQEADQASGDDDPDLEDYLEESAERLTDYQPDDDAETAAAHRRFEAAAEAGDTEGAFSEFSRGAARGLWPLSQQEEIIAVLMRIAVDDRSLPIHRYAEMVHAADWDRPIKWEGEDNRALRERVLARLAAERWYTDLKALAAGSGGKFEARQQRLIARAFLGRLRRWRMRLIAKQSLQNALEEYERHQPWVLPLVSQEHADYLVWLRDTWLKAKAHWSASQQGTKRFGAAQIIFIVIAIQVVIAVLRDCQGQH